MYMVNNFKKAAYLLCCLFIILSYSSYKAQGQKLSKYYTTSTQENGTLYFINPQSGFQNSSLKSSLIYDITYLSNQKDATFNFSYIDPTIQEIDSIAFHYVGKTITVPAEKLFIDNNKKSWIHRYTSKVPFESLVQMFQGQNPISMDIITKKERISMKANPKKWKSHATINEKILTLIQYNQK